MRLLIDGDILRYRVGFAAQKSKYGVVLPDEETPGPIATFDTKKELKAWVAQFMPEEHYEIIEIVEPDTIENCLHSVKQVLESIMNRLGSNDVTVFLTGKDNFRDKLVDYYKANRDRNRKPYHYDNITNYLVDIWNAIVVDGYEADDAMAIRQLALTKATGQESSIICTTDKDLDMVPGWHYNFVHDKHYFISEVEGLRNFYSQMLTGDDSDNIPGLYKCTGTKATKTKFNGIVYAETAEQMYSHVHHVYSKAFYDIDPDNKELDTDAIHKAVTEKLREIGKLLWMKRTADDVWEPPV